MIDLLFTVLHWCASCAPAGNGVSSAVGAFGGGAGAAGGMGGLGGLAGGAGDGAGGDGNADTESSPDDADAPSPAEDDADTASVNADADEPGSGNDAPYSAPEPATSGPDHDAWANAMSQAAAQSVPWSDVVAAAGIEPDPVGQAVVGLGASGPSIVGQGITYGAGEGLTEGIGEVAGEGTLTAGSQPEPSTRSGKRRERPRTR
jgi:hypothetical protein